MTPNPQPLTQRSPRKRRQTEEVTTELSSPQATDDPQDTMQLLATINSHLTAMIHNNQVYNLPFPQYFQLLTLINDLVKNLTAVYKLQTEACIHPIHEGQRVS